MKIKEYRSLFVLQVLIFFLLTSLSAYAAEQVVYPQPGSATSHQGSSVSVDVYYNTSDSGSTPGLGLRLHWNSDKLEFTGLSNILNQAFFVQGTSEQDLEDIDGDSQTDYFVNLAWLDLDANWPPNTPVRLFKANFQIIAEGQTQVNFSSSATASGYSLNSTSYELQADSSVGSLQIVIIPQEAADAGAMWRVAGTQTWYYSGETATNIPVGRHTVEFRTVPGWRPIESITVDVEQGSVGQYTGNYQEHSNALPGVMMLLLDE